MERRAVLLLVVAGCVGLASYTASNQAADAPDAPFTGDFAPDPGAFSGTLKVVSYNIAFADEVDRAIEELGEAHELRGADIVLLQEMDDAGSERIARALHCNYVYFPASIHSRHDRYFGNAILSRWPIREPERVVLPHRSPTNGQQRIAVRAVVDVAGLGILVYSVHTETPWLSRRKRTDQVESLLESIEPAYRAVIVGGDFNTLTADRVQDLTQRFRQAGLERASRGTEATVAFYPLTLTLDHIFARGLAPLDAGTVEEATASDHRPIWATLRLGPASVPG